MNCKENISTCVMEYFEGRVEEIAQGICDKCSDEMMQVINEKNSEQETNLKKVIEEQKVTLTDLINKQGIRINELEAQLSQRAAAFCANGTLSTPGYYRIARIPTYSLDNTKFNNAGSFIISLNTSYYSVNNMSMTLLCNMSYNKYKITKLGESLLNKIVSKLRISRNSKNELFIDIMYTANSRNGIKVDFLNTSYYEKEFSIVNFQPVTDTDLVALIEYTL